MQIWEALCNKFYSFRDHLLTSPSFQHWAAKFPITRPLARRRAKDLFDLCAGFVYSQVLLACVRLNLLQLLKQQTYTANQLATTLNIPDEAMQRLLDAAVALELLSLREDKYGLGIHGAALLGNEGVMAMIEHHSMFYRDLEDPLALMRGELKETQLQQYWSYIDDKSVSEQDSEKIKPYTHLMSSSQPLVAEQILEAYSFSDNSCLLDVGGGDGTFLRKVANQYPHLKLKLFDLPAVSVQAKQEFEKAGLSDRVSIHGGSFLSDALPDGADVISLVRIVHDHNDDAVMTLLKSARQALKGNGKLIIAEPMSGLKETGAMADAYFGFYFLAMGRGKPRTAERLFEMLDMAGFRSQQIIPTLIPLQTSLVIAST